MTILEKIILTDQMIKEKRERATGWKHFPAEFSCDLLFVVRRFIELRALPELDFGWFPRCVVAGAGMVLGLVVRWADCWWFWVGLEVGIWWFVVAFGWGLWDFGWLSFAGGFGGFRWWFGGHSTELMAGLKVCRSSTGAAGCYWLSYNHGGASKASSSEMELASPRMLYCCCRLAN